MSTSWNNIAEHLRQELAAYGGLLHLFEQQQRSLFARQPDAVLQFSTEIQAQVEQVAETRGRREQLVGEFATAHGRPADTALRELFGFIEPAARPLLEALISEINLLLHRVRRANRQNHTLLNRAVTLHRETLQQLRPSAFHQTYSPAGKVSVSADRSASKLCAAS
jgi:flagellar biosynthesis/type III secretory pathway chaperone